MKVLPLISIVLFTAFVLVIQYLDIKNFRTADFTASFASISSAPVDLRTSNPRAYAEQVLERLYAHSWKILYDQCTTDEFVKDCMLRLYEKELLNNTVPWWMQSLLRFPVHERMLQFPTFDFCRIEKVSSTEWRQIHCMANNSTFPKCPQREVRKQPADVESVVFIRDPLERFLSAFIDKCITHHRKGEGHCEPNSVFMTDQEPGLKDRDNVVEPLLQSPKRFFEAYVDVTPLEWNIHVKPQALYCGGLHRRHMNFVGHLETLVEDAATVGERYGVTQAIDGVIGKPKPGRSRKTASHLKEYYTPRTLRRVLAYVSLDYVILNLTLPNWAIEVLAEEDDSQW